MEGILWIVMDSVTVENRPGNYGCLHSQYCAKHDENASSDDRLFFTGKYKI